MRILIASDHAGYDLKEIIKSELTDKDIKFVDLGTHSNISVDYPDYGKLSSRIICAALVTLDSSLTKPLPRESSN